VYFLFLLILIVIAGLDPAILFTKRRWSAGSSPRMKPRTPRRLNFRRGTGHRPLRPPTRALERLRQFRVREISTRLPTICSDRKALALKPPLIEAAGFYDMFHGTV